MAPAFLPFKPLSPLVQTPDVDVPADLTFAWERGAVNVPELDAVPRPGLHVDDRVADHPVVARLWDRFPSLVVVAVLRERISRLPVLAPPVVVLDDLPDLFLPVVSEAVERLVDILIDPEVLV